jgi:two-component system, chemotaxis family, sensor kinase CheA
VSFFSDDRVSELRALFFESAQELLQAMNDAGLELEKRPDDMEVVRTIRRAVHTMKGDSAACGFKELSDLAHVLEDVLTPEIATRADASAAQVVLTAADMFDSMLSAYQGNIQPPDATPVYDMIHALVREPEAPVVFDPAFDWTEYEQLVVANSDDERPLYNVAVDIDPQCVFPSAAVQLVKNVLNEAGALLVIRPDDTTPVDKAVLVLAVVASDRDPQWIEKKCYIPSVAASVLVKPFDKPCVDFNESEPPETEAATDGEPEAEIPDAELNVEFNPESQSPPAEETENESAAALPVDFSHLEAVIPETVAPLAPAAESPAEQSHVHALSETVLRVDAERIDNVLNLVGELIIARSMLAETINEFGRQHSKDPLRSKFADVLAQNSRVLNDLQRSVMKIRMVPVEQLFRRFPRVVRDVAKRRGKDVQVAMSGHETDLDKSILDALAEPMTHLVRNAVDHGIEMPQDRVASGKPAQGTVKLNAYHQGNHVVVEVSDDGRGIDAQNVAAKAVRRGLITPEQACRLSNAEILNLIFESDFSTASKVDDISGRGVGLDVVRTVLQRMKGSVSVMSRPGEGTTFLLRVPLTLAIIRALLFRVLDRLYALPLQTVLEIARATSADVHKVDNHEVLRLRNELLTLVRVSHLEKDHKGRENEKLFVIVSQLAGSKFGLVVDKLEGEEELVIKALDDHLVATDLVSGASILGDGRVVLILNVAAVVERLADQARAGSGLGGTIGKGRSAGV